MNVKSSRNKQFPQVEIAICEYQLYTKNFKHTYLVFPNN